MNIKKIIALSSVAAAIAGMALTASPAFAQYYNGYYPNYYTGYNYNNYNGYYPNSYNYNNNYYNNYNNGQNAVAAYDDYFTPKVITVPAGTTVTWINSGSDPHSVTSDTRIFDSGTLAPDATFSFTFNNPGTFPYYCKFHGGPGGAGMSGIVIVTNYGMYGNGYYPPYNYNNYNNYNNYYPYNYYPNNYYDNGYGYGYPYTNSSYYYNNSWSNNNWYWNRTRTYYINGTVQATSY